MFLSKKDRQINSLKKSVGRLQNEKNELQTKLKKYDSSYLDKKIKAVEDTQEEYEKLIYDLKEQQSDYKQMVHDFEFYKKDTEKQLNTLLNNNK